MNTKLTLSIEKDVIESAKEYARSKGRSLSDLVENYLKFVSAGKKEKNAKEKFSPEISELAGSIHVPTDFDYDKARSESLHEKYGL